MGEGGGERKRSLAKLSRKVRNAQSFALSRSSAARVHANESQEQESDTDGWRLERVTGQHSRYANERVRAAICQCSLCRSTGRVT